MPKRLKFVIEQRVLFMVRQQTWQVRRFEISNRPITFESNRDVRFKFESNLETSQVPSCKVAERSCGLPHKKTRTPWYSSQPPFCPKWADRAQNSLNIVTP